MSVSFPEQQEPNHRDELSMLSLINTLEVITDLSSNFVCKICHNFLIDICSLPCGHKFCKFCALSWLRLESTCPICREETYRPFAGRCYEMDSVIDDFYPMLYQFYHNLEKTDDGTLFIEVGVKAETTRCRNGNLQDNNNQDFDYAKSIHDLRRRMNGDGTSISKTIQICSPSERDELRRKRRALSEKMNILLGAPCTSMLQKLATLGWGTSAGDQSIILGMRMMVWVVLCFVFWNFLYIFHHPWFNGGLRTIVYSFLMLVAVNLMQMQLFPNLDQAHNLLDFELWEHRYQTPSADMNESSSNDDVDRSMNNRGGQGSSGLRPSSNDSSKECEGGGGCSASTQELERINRWKKEGKLDLERMFKTADALLEALYHSPTMNN